MSNQLRSHQRIRKSFQRSQAVAPLPDLIELQKRSYKAFLQKELSHEKREDSGLQAAWKSVFPINDFSGKSQLEFYKYDFDTPKYDVDECMQRGITYSAPLRVTFRLVVWDLDEDTGARSVRDIKEQEVYVGDIPLMTDNGTFIVNGVERVVVSQMHRSPGVFFDHDRGKSHSSGKFLFNARVIPYRGSWIDFEFDGKDILYVRIDRRRKLPVTTLLMALDSADSAKKRAEADLNYTNTSAEAGFEFDGMSREEILSTFYKTLSFETHKKGWKVEFDPQRYRSKKLLKDLVDAKSGKVILAAGEKMTPRKAKKFQEDGLSHVLVPEDELVGSYVASDYINLETGEIFAEAGDELTEALLKSLLDAGHKKIDVLDIDNINRGSYLRDTLAVDRNVNREEALIDIYRVLRPGEPPTLESAEALFGSLFFDPDRYDLSAVGRVKMNSRLGLSHVDDKTRVLTKEDVVEIVRILLDLKDGQGQIDDIDNLANRRVRSVGELLENQYRVGLLRMERAIRERMSSIEIDSVMPNDLINAKPAAAAVKEFFGSSQLSQFMDQTNPLTEVTHKRRLSALGPGGLTRDRATFEVRDVHPTHYGRICPIETPEGPNIGLINSLSSYARVNKYGFIETPYRKVVDGRVTDEVTYMSAMEEWKYSVAQATAAVNEKGELTEQFVVTRKAGEVVVTPAAEVEYMDVSPKQLVSVAASLIPFLENDDANRALMGSNMQRQAVPLLTADAPLVGTGMESIVARDSGVVVTARRSGVVDQIDGTRIVVRTEGTEEGSPGVDIYRLRKFQRTNQNTCFTQKPLVRVGDYVHAGDVIADGPSTDRGELALGKNVLVSFLSWNGYNFEDSIIISERIVKDDVFTSIHIEEFEVMARDTKLGQEDITRDIPNVGDEALRNLDEAGIVAIGAEVKPGDILVGKVTPKGESPATPEEKLLRAIFGEKASDVRDTSLKLPPGTVGTVVDVRIFSRRGVEKDERALAIEQAEVERLANDRDAERNILEKAFYAQLKSLLDGQKIASGPKGVKKGAVIDDKLFEELTPGQLRQVTVADDKVMADIEALKSQIDASLSELQSKFEDRVEKVRRGDDLPPGVMKMVKVFVAVKRKLQPGDKMAGRHGNKGVVSRIVPVEDMPFLEDGTPVDMILNPLGLPSRMNVGQILETHMGWACSGMGYQVAALIDQYKASKKTQKELKELKEKLSSVYIREDNRKALADLDEDDLLRSADQLRKGVPIATPVFDGAGEPDVTRELENAGLDCSGQVTLYDGRTGKKFDRPVTVGYKYMLKLHHLVDDKIHARSIGPYSLVTQQPLGGKAQFGGQRFGEMEVWALEAYGAAYTLQEMLTIKSDDVSGRTKVYESIVRGDDAFEAGIPESFNVLVKELRALGLNMKFQSNSIQ